MDRLAFTFAVLALGAAAWLWLTRGEDDRAQEGAATLEAALEGRMASLEARLKQLEASRTAPAIAPAIVPPGGAEAPTLVGSGDAAATTPAATLEVRPKTVEERLAALEEQATKAAERSAGLPIPLRMLGPHSIASDLASLDKIVDLDSVQESRIERIVENAKGALERLHETPNESGETLASLQRAMAQPVDAGDGNTDGMMARVGRLMAFRGTKVPGTDETYGQAERRIREHARRDMRAELRSDQHERFDRADVGPMLGGAAMGGGVSIAFSEVVSVEEED